MKRRFILELRRFWMTHPKYRRIADNIQGKYSFRERPAEGIILKTSSATHVQLSADNFQGTVLSYVHLAKFEDYPGMAVEWVREDKLAIQRNGGEFPSPPGTYFVEITEAPDPNPPYDKLKKFEFYVDPLLDVVDESAQKLDDFVWMTEHPYLEGTTKVWEMPGAIPLTRGIHYEEKAGNEIHIKKPLGSNSYLSVDYRYAAESTGPWSILENHAHKNAIPGCTLAFGRRIEQGDKFAVVIHRRRQPAALEYGGRWDISLDFDVIATDPYVQQEITDATIMYLWGIARNRLSTEGIEIDQVSMGGETEEIRDEVGDDYFYGASFSVSVQTDWAIHVPLSATIRRVSPQTREQAEAVAGMTDDELREATDVQNIHAMEDLGLRSFEDPFFVGRTSTFETIK